MNSQAKEKKELVCFIVAKDRSCDECKAELPRGSFLFLEEDRPLCLLCADLDHLIFLPRGDAALTRRARKESPISVVVVKFSRARKRYERQGLLVTEDALCAAEAACLADADVRERRRERDQRRREVEDKVFAEEMKERILELYPSCPEEDALSISRHTTIRGSGRVGRSAAGRALDDNAIELAVRAHIRHCYTKYDEWLMKHGDRAYARRQIAGHVDEVCEQWCQEAL